MNIDLPEDKARDAVVDILKHLNCTSRELRRLFLVEDLVDSIKVSNLKEELFWMNTELDGQCIQGCFYNHIFVLFIMSLEIYSLDFFCGCWPMLDPGSMAWL